MKNLGVILGYLDNIMICIDAAIKGSFTGLDVSVSVSVEEFLLKLNTIMLGLSQDTLNIDLNLYLEFRFLLCHQSLLPEDWPRTLPER